jgi:hypothetical protein
LDLLFFDSPGQSLEERYQLKIDQNNAPVVFADYATNTVVFAIPRGTGANKHVYLNLNGENGIAEPVPIIVSYPSPVVTAASPFVIEQDDKRFVHRYAITIFGNFFGYDSFTHREIKVGNFPCTGIRFNKPDSEMVCWVSGTGINNGVVVTVDGQQNETPNNVCVP